MVAGGPLTAMSEELEDKDCRVKGQLPSMDQSEPERLEGPKGTASESFSKSKSDRSLLCSKDSRGFQPLRIQSQALQPGLETPSFLALQPHWPV